MRRYWCLPVLVADLHRDTCKPAAGSRKGLPTAQPINLAQPINVAQQGLDIITVTRTALAPSPATDLERGVLAVLRCLG